MTAHAQYSTPLSYGPRLTHEISSNARPRVRGPNTPIETHTTAMLAAMKPNTPGVPKRSRKNPIMRLVNTVDKRLHE